MDPESLIQINICFIGCLLVCCWWYDGHC